MNASTTGKERPFKGRVRAQESTGLSPCDALRTPLPGERKQRPYRRRLPRTRLRPRLENRHLPPLRSQAAHRPQMRPQPPARVCHHCGFHHRVTFRSRRHPRTGSPRRWLSTSPAQSQRPPARNLTLLAEGLTQRQAAAPLVSSPAALPAPSPTCANATPPPPTKPSSP